MITTAFILTYSGLVILTIPTDSLSCLQAKAQIESRAIQFGLNDKAAARCNPIPQLPTTPRGPVTR
jgi:hypothetical protein